MTSLRLIAGIGLIVLGAAILILASGYRRYYSGLFFVLMGIVVLVRRR
jgi:hypothetical protein